MAYNIYTNLFYGQTVSRAPSISEPKKTTDKKLIKNWVEMRQGKPALLQQAQQNNEPVLCIKFPDSTPSTAPLQEISWEEFFLEFDRLNFVMVYREQQEKGEQSPFCKLMRRKAW